MNNQKAMAEEDKQKILANYFKGGNDGKLEIFPRKEKRKLIVLENIVKRFELNKTYTENEINEILKSIFADFATIRRALIDYGLMERNRDCTEYWVKVKLG